MRKREKSVRSIYKEGVKLKKVTLKVEQVNYFGTNRSLNTERLCDFPRARIDDDYSLICFLYKKLFLE
jgi:hypothetical protein